MARARQLRVVEPRLLQALLVVTTVTAVYRELLVQVVRGMALVVEVVIWAGVEGTVREVVDLVLFIYQVCP
jgi:diacylglycerol kinase family enzyme